MHVIRVSTTNRFRQSQEDHPDLSFRDPLLIEVRYPERPRSVELKCWYQSSSCSAVASEVPLFFGILFELHNKEVPDSYTFRALCGFSIDLIWLILSCSTSPY